MHLEKIKQINPELIVKAAISSKLIDENGLAEKEITLLQDRLIVLGDILIKQLEVNPIQLVFIWDDFLALVKFKKELHHLVASKS